mmetsp:Transcript_3800/g.11142  ORF Transcript_3800/g.11142 Transcript_3800/m.11142 type:complete len:240 (-) Transcript_3800:594-1313(-)
MPMVFSCEVAILQSLLLTIFSRMSRRFISASCARLAAKAADASPSASPSACLPLAIFDAASILALVSLPLAKASASAAMRAVSPFVCEVTPRSMARIWDLSLETSSSASLRTFCASTSRSASILAMSLDVVATTSAVFAMASLFMTSAFSSAAILALSHSSRSFCLPSSLLSFWRPNFCFMCCMLVFESKSVFSSKSFAISPGMLTFFTVKWWMCTPNLLNFSAFISSTMCWVLAPCRS